MKLNSPLVEVHVLYSFSLYSKALYFFVNIAIVLLQKSARARMSCKLHTNSFLPSVQDFDLHRHLFYGLVACLACELLLDIVGHFPSIG